MAARVQEELGHSGVDTVVPGRSGRGGLLVMIDRLVRRWYPKGTDFSRTSWREIRDLEDWINSMHRESLNGETAYDYDSCLAKKDYFLLTHYPCKLPSFFAIRTSGPPLCSLGRIWYNMRH